MFTNRVHLLVYVCTAYTKGGTTEGEPGGTTTSGTGAPSEEKVATTESPSEVTSTTTETSPSEEAANSESTLATATQWTARDTTTEDMPTSSISDGAHKFALKIIVHTVLLCSTVHVCTVLYVDGFHPQAATRLGCSTKPSLKVTSN